MNRFRFFSIILMFFTLLSCSGLDDLIFNRHPQLGDIQLSSPQVEPFDTVYASIEATNPIDGTLEYKWSVKRLYSVIPSIGTIDGPSDLDSVRWIAPIEGGYFEFKVIVSNTAKETPKTKEIEVLVFEKPIVKILKPAAGDYFVAGQSFAIEARADHANGLSWVKAFVKGNLIEQKSQNATGIYLFAVTADSSMVGQPYIKIEAKSKTVDETGADSIQVEIGGIIPGKNGN